MIGEGFKVTANDILNDAFQTHPSVVKGRLRYLGGLSMHRQRCNRSKTVSDANIKEHMENNVAVATTDPTQEGAYTL